MTNKGELVAFDPEPPRFFLTCMAGHLSNTIVGYDERNQMSFCAAPDFAMQYLTLQPTSDTMILVKKEDRVCIKLT